MEDLLHNRCSYLSQNQKNLRRLQKSCTLFANRTRTAKTGNSAGRNAGQEIVELMVERDREQEGNFVNLATNASDEGIP